MDVYGILPRYHIIIICDKRYRDVRRFRCRLDATPAPSYSMRMFLREHLNHQTKPGDDGRECGLLYDVMHNLSLLTET